MSNGGPTLDTTGHAATEDQLIIDPAGQQRSERKIKEMNYTE